MNASFFGSKILVLLFLSMSCLVNVIYSSSDSNINIVPSPDKTKLQKINDILSSYKLSFNGHYFFRESSSATQSVGSNANDTKYACLSYYDNLAQVSSLFTKCVINNSRPFHLCQNCAQYYLQVKDTYNLIIGESHLFRTIYSFSNCKN